MRFWERSWLNHVLLIVFTHPKVASLEKLGKVGAEREARGMQRTSVLYSVCS